jgi:hypothetical protein
MNTQFFGTAVGDQMVNPHRYSDSIKKYLTAEHAFLEGVSRPFSTIVEVGCMQGRLVEWCVGQQKRYIGIDVECGYQDAWSTYQQRYGDAIEFVRGDAQKLSEVVKRIKKPLSVSSTLFVFPFNSFGNIENVQAAVQSLSEVKMKFVIFSYDTISYANQVRAEYYRMCGLSDITQINSDEGVIFSSREGLKSFAYHISFLSKCFKHHGTLVEPASFGDIGIAWNNIFI